jgi:hypothetical protein
VQTNGERHTVSARYTVSLHKKSRLRQHLEMWRGKAFTAEELKGFDLEKLIGANGQMQVVHNVADEGKVYANVQAIVPAQGGSPKLAPLNYVRVKERPANGTGEPGAGDGDTELPF